MRLSPIIILALSAAAAFPAGASASQVSVDPTTHVPLFEAGRKVTDVAVRDSFNGTTLADAAQPLFVGPGCATGTPVFCAGAWGVDARLSPLGDHFDYRGSFPATVVAGDGDDVVNAIGIGNQVKAGPGNDQVWANGGTVIVTGGQGDDQLYGTETGTDLSGGEGDDLVFGDSNAGQDAIDGNDGDDVLVGGPGSVSGGGTAHGGPGNDVIVVQGYPWTIAGGIGDDIVRGGPASDTITTGDGADTIDAVDGEKDSINCGADNDIVYADATDKVAANCEQVSRGPAPVLPAVDDALARASAFKAARR